MASRNDIIDSVNLNDPIVKMPNKKVNLDNILVEEIGQFGRYQVRTLILTLVVIIFGAWGATEYIFTTARIKTRCLIPECEGSEAAEFSPTWILNAIPASGSSFDNCLRFDSSNGTPSRDECPAEWFNRKEHVGCTEYVYENTNTVAYDYGLACEEWRRAFIGTARTFGTFLALPLVGFTSDRWGRRFALSLNALNTAWVGTVRYWADTYYGFVISEVVESAIGAGAYSCAYILVMELVGPKYRVAAGATISTFFSFGQVLMALIAWAVPNWRNLTLALYLPQFITICYFWIMSESVRWYLSKGQFKNAEDFLKNVARTNKRQLSDQSLQALKHSAEAEKIRADAEKVTKAKEPWLIILVFRNKAILRRCCISPVWWFTSALVYYGMSINAVNISGNRYVNYMAVAAADIPGYWIAVVLMTRIGRKPVLIGAYWICAACQLGYIFLPINKYGLSMMMYLIGKLAIAVVMMSLYIYTSEIYPTRYRHSLFAFSSMIGRIGAMTAPLTPAFGAALFDNFPSMLFCGFALLSGALVFLAPETLGTKLPDTLEEAADIGANKSDPRIVE
ncbi:organic cation transporter protein-like [Pararge aegeria]|uniref:Jg15626 protein n=1 Tax=Pararge aegeria aegeria TaxID=348720 RepID=A0A8S4S0K5_9NEOP|nr:organic cation transporter protein-like [Pararge aegeria]CAH2241429.1 jg15626 [Pararge aegeria aegeria]